MSLYALALFLHIVGALGVFSALALEWGGLYNLRRAESLGQFREWAGLLRGVHRVAAPAALTLVVTGVYMAAGRWGNQAWIDLGFLAMVAVAVSGSRIIGPRLAAVARDVATEGVLTAEHRKRVRDAGLLVLLWVRTGLGLGIVLLMTTKPSAGLALADLGVAAGLGLAVGLATVSRRSPAFRAAGGTAGA